LYERSVLTMSAYTTLELLLSSLAPEIIGQICEVSVIEGRKEGGKRGRRDEPFSSEVLGFHTLVSAILRNDDVAYPQQKVYRVHPKAQGSA